jgi:hypothetical protein
VKEKTKLFFLRSSNLALTDNNASGCGTALDEYKFTVKWNIQNVCQGRISFSTKKQQSNPSPEK